MKLAEEIAVYQYAQGVLSEEEVVGRFVALPEEGRLLHYRELYTQVYTYGIPNDVIEVAIEKSGVDPDNEVCRLLKMQLSRKGMKSALIMADLPDTEPEKVYRFLLYLFSNEYQQKRIATPENADDWRYRDLSDQSLVESLLDEQVQLLEAIYQDPEFRSEFLSLARLYTRYTQEKQEPTPEPRFFIEMPSHFLSYDELLAASLRQLPDPDGNLVAIDLLADALTKALTKHYKIPSESARKLLWEVVKKHMAQRMKE